MRTELLKLIKLQRKDMNLNASSKYKKSLWKVYAYTRNENCIWTKKPWEPMNGNELRTGAIGTLEGYRIYNSAYDKKCLRPLSNPKASF